MGLQNWSTTPANNANAAPNINMATGSAPSTVHPSVRQMMADVASWYADPEWVLQADTPTYISATSFTVPTNRTATYSVGRRIQMAGPGIGTPYTINGTITASAFGTVTTVTVQWDSGSLDNTVSSVGVGILQNQLSKLLSDLANTTDLANNTDMTKGVAFVGGAARVVASISALRTLPKTGSPEVFVTGYYTQGDGGGGAYWYDATDTTTADNGVTVIVASDGGRWKLASQAELSLKQVGAKGDWATDDSAAFQFMATNTLQRGWVIPESLYKFNTAINFDYSAGGFPTPGTRSARAWIRGASRANTILGYNGLNFAINMTGSPAGLAGQGIYSLDKLSDFTLEDNSFTQKNSGIYLLRKEFFKLENLLISGMQDAVRIDSCFSSAINNLTVMGCQNGLDLRDSGDGAPNAIWVSEAEFQSCSLVGITAAQMGGANRFSAVNCEACGTQGNAATGGIYLNFTGTTAAGPIRFDSCHFEQNAGGFDVSIINAATTAGTELVVIFDHCSFNRASSTDYTTYNILLRNNTGMKIKCILIGCSFTSTGSYVPSAARPFISGDAFTEIIDYGSTYNEATSLGHSNTHGRTMAGQVSATGVLSSGPPQISVVHTGTGVYDVTHNSQFAFDTLSYFVTALANDGAGIKVERIAYISKSHFTVVVSNTAGTLTDGAFTFMVMQVN